MPHAQLQSSCEEPEQIEQAAKQDLSLNRSVGDKLASQ